MNDDGVALSRREKTVAVVAGILLLVGLLAFIAVRAAEGFGS